MYKIYHSVNGEETLIGSAKTSKLAMNVATDWINENRFDDNYTRWWDKDGATHIDFGSHSNFLVIRPNIHWPMK